MLNTIQANKGLSNHLEAREWMQHRACDTHHPHEDYWYPEVRNRYERKIANETALYACGRCPVRRQCLDLAIKNRERHGIWGGRDFDTQPVCGRCDHIISLYTAGASGQKIIDATGKTAPHLAQHLSHHGHYTVAKDLGWIPSAKTAA